MAAAASVTLNAIRVTETSINIIMNNNDLLGWILKITVGTLALICVSTVGVLLIGLFEDGVSNEKIFETISPAFNTVVGAFVGLLGGLSINKGSSDRDKDKK